MDSQAEPAASNSASPAKNPITAVGQKVKSVLGTHQRPSVRILRGSSSNNVPRQTPQASSPEEKAPTGRFSSIRLRTLFSRDDNRTSSGLSQEEYDTDTVDLLDVVGTQDTCDLVANQLTLNRS